MDEDLLKDIVGGGKKDEHEVQVVGEIQLESKIHDVQGNEHSSRDSDSHDEKTDYKTGRPVLVGTTSVEPAPGVDTEGLEVATECLVDVFRLGTRSGDEQVQPHLLVDLFTSAGLNPCREQESTKPDQAVSSLTIPSEHISPGPINNEGTPRSVDEAVSVEPRVQETGAVSRDELFEQFREVWKMRASLQIYLLVLLIMLNS